MKTFDDLIFEPYSVDPLLDRVNPTYANYLKTLTHSYIEFPNGYALSICFGKIYPINKIGYSVGVFKNQERLRSTGYDRQCVIKDDVDKIIPNVQLLR